jgi:glucokinase
MRLVMDLGGTCIRHAYVSHDGKLDVSRFCTEKVAQAISTPDELCEMLVGIIAAADRLQTDFVLSFAGPISADNRVVRRYTNVLPLDADLPVAEMIEKAVRKRVGRRIRVHVIKDAVASGMAEMGPHGAAARCNEVLALILGTGTGGAPCRRLADGTIVFPDALADLGHYQVDVDFNEPCNCGARGCVERQTSGAAIVDAMNRLARDAHFAAEYRDSYFHKRGILPGAITGEDIAAAVGEGDRMAIDGLRAAAKPLSVLLRNVFTSHPGMTIVLVGGFALGTGGVLLELVRGALRETGIPFVKRSELAAFVEARILLGAIPADQTNLVGARQFLLQEELQSSRGVEEVSTTGILPSGSLLQGKEKGS